jgi:transcriptional regulator with XRE-family HTH domain
MDKAKIIKEYRELNKMTQKEVADKLNMTHSAYSKYERYERGINDEIWFKLCAILGIPRDYNKRSTEDYELIFLENYNIELKQLTQRIKKTFNYSVDKEKEKAAETFRNYISSIEQDKKNIVKVLKEKKLEKYINEYGMNEYF